MAVSRKDFFSVDHIRASAFHVSFELAEQALHCLELVCELVEENLPFQFKGGNSLLIILDRPQRFSIDVDIATDCPKARIEEALDRIVNRFGVFYRWAPRQHKTKPWIPLTSYYLYYKPAFPREAESSIMLDVQLHLSPYRCEKKKISCGNLFRSDVSVDVPLPAGIVGDKLLTLGPDTLGIPIGKGKAHQRLKHVFDISCLLDLHPRLYEIRESFDRCLAFENRLQDKNVCCKEVVLDTIGCLRSVIDYSEPPENPEKETALGEHCSGFSRFKAHLFNSDYSWHDLRIDMSRAAFCIAAVGSEAVSEEEFFRVLTHDHLPMRVCKSQESDRQEQLYYYWKYIDKWSDSLP